MNTGIVLGLHTDFRRGIKKYGSISAMPQHPVIERFAKEGNVTVFSCDSADYSNHLPRNCNHVRIHSRIVYIFLSWLMIATESNKRDIEYLYYQSGSSIFGLPFVNKLTRAKTILFYGVMLHSNASGFKHIIYRKFERWSLGYCDYMIYGSIEIFSFVLTESKFKGAFLAIHKGVRLSKEKKGIKRDRKRIIWCGRMEPVKDPMRAIRVFNEHVLPRHPDAKLVMCGTGSLFMEALSKTYVMNGLHVLGHRHDMPEQFQKSGILLMTSKYEGSPDICPEAMAMKLPIVSTNVGGVMSYVFSHMNGYLCDTDEELGYVLNRLLSNSDLARRLGNNGYKRAWRNHDLITNTDKLVRFMKEGLI